MSRGRARGAEGEWANRLSTCVRAHVKAEQSVRPQVKVEYVRSSASEGVPLGQTHTVVACRAVCTNVLGSGGGGGGAQGPANAAKR